MHGIKTWIVSTLVVIWAYLADIHGMMFAIGGLIIIDTVLGILKSRKKGIRITSRRLSAFISKTLLYQVAIITIYMIDRHIFGDVVSIFIQSPLISTKIIATIICLIELYSIKENLDSITGMNIWSHAKGLITRSTKEVMDIKKGFGDEDPAA